MDISFETRKLRKICENLAYARESLGPDIADQLISQLADLRAGETIDELEFVLPDLVLEEGNGYSTLLKDETRLYFCPNHQYREMHTNPEQHLLGVSRIKILKIGSG